MRNCLKTTKGLVALLVAFSFLLSCTKGGDDGGSSSDDPMDQNSQRQFNTDCGTVVNGELKNPVAESEGFLVEVTSVADNNQVVVQRSSGPQLVKILGLSDNVQAFQEDSARNILSGLLGPAVLFEGGSASQCEVNTSGRNGALIASLFSRRNGTSFAESLLRNGVAEAEVPASCNSELVTSCYAALAEMNRPQIGAPVSDFLWKPVAERDGNLVVLLNPFGARIFANDEELVATGPSNGRGTTARGNRPGCAFGTNVVVRALDPAGRILVFPGNQTEFVIPDGCSRVEF